MASKADPYAGIEFEEINEATGIDDDDNDDDSGDQVEMILFQANQIFVSKEFGKSTWLLNILQDYYKFPN